MAEPHDGLARTVVLSPKRPRRDYDGALAYARKAFAHAPEKGSYWVLALAEYPLEHWSESLAASSKSMGMSKGGDPRDWLTLSLTFWRQSDKEEARFWFDKAVAQIKKTASQDKATLQLWAEAAQLLGQPGPDLGSPKTRSDPVGTKGPSPKPGT